MVALAIFLSSEYLKSNFPNKNVVIAEFFFCAEIFWSIELFLLERVCLRDVNEKEVNGSPDTVTTITQKVYRILKIVFKFVLF